MRKLICAVLVCVLVGCEKKTESGSGGAAAAVADEWTHKELLEHLNKKGLKLRAVPTIYKSAYGRPVFFVTESSHVKTDEDAIAAYEKKSGELVYCRLQKTPQEARDEIGVAGRGFAYGRFIFLGEPPLYDRVRSALP